MFLLRIQTPANRLCMAWISCLSLIHISIACKEYAFKVLNANTVYSIVRDTNTASQKVAVRNGMQIIDKDTKNFRYIDMDFFLYSAAVSYTHLPAGRY